MEPRFEKIPIDKIRKGSRIREDPGNLELLAKTISPLGLLQPIVVQQEDDGTYTLLVGKRRVEACKLLRWKEIDALIINIELVEGTSTS